MHHAARLVRRKSSQFFNKDKGGNASDVDAESEPKPAAMMGDKLGGLTSMSSLSSEQEQQQQPENPSTATTTVTMTPEDSLNAFQLFEALRNFEPGTNDPAALLKLVDSAAGANNASAIAGARAGPPQLPTPLHTAIRCAKPGTIHLIMGHRPDDINARDVEGHTPLHLAANLGRTEVVKLLFSQPNIDDTLKDNQGRTALQVAKSADTAKIIQVSRAQYNESYLSLLTNYVNSPGGTSGTMTPTHASRHSLSSIPHHFTSPNPDGSLTATNYVGETGDARDLLFKFLSKERARSVDYSSLTSGTRGTTLIHEAARRRDIDLLKLAQARGASMVVRDRRGKMPLDVAGKDESVRSLLRSSASTEGRMLKDNVGGATAASGASGQQQTQVIKGYLSKWTNMARGYRTRWFVLQHGHLSYYRDQEEEGQASRGAISMSVAVVDLASDKSTFTVGTTLGKSARWYLKGNHPVEAMQWVSALRNAIEAAKAGAVSAGQNTQDAPAGSGLGILGDNFASRTTSSNASVSSFSTKAAGGLAPASISSNGSSAGGLAVKPAFPALDRSSTSATGLSDYETFTRSPSPGGTEGSILGDDDASTSGGEGTGLSRQPPHDENFAVLANSAKTQVTLTQQLLDSMALSTTDPARRTEMVQAAKRSLAMLSSMLETHVDQVGDREKWFVRRYEREIEAKRMWEENMRSVVSSQAELEQQLADTQKSNSRRKKALRDLKASVLADIALSESAAAGTGGVEQQGQAKTTGTTRPVPAPVQTTVTSPSGTTVPKSAMSTLTVQQAIQDAAVSDMSSDDEDEDDFYDAVESGNIPITVETPIASPNHEREWPKEMSMESEERVFELQGYEGYKNLRDRLPIANDERPPVSLWAILKGSIGKDLTKISFPVYFNEPTSMLQRMAEDMEYSECLDAASQEQDSLKRLCYVAGFGMSNYASTIGRIAKPFNPMLSETFELVNLEKKYRYVSEQVSHHPPISACIAESPNYLYFGEVDAKNKFLGKSFEIRPTGIAHAELILPKEWAPSYPAARRRDGYVREHYSWKKVTTSVSNFIMGAPQIDHYGDMEVTNHRTGERCLLTFKPKGWRAGNACELKGTVYDANGTLRWELAGRWNGQLVARRAGAGHGALNPDDSVPVAPEYILVWKINKQPPNMPFNLTRFALTLNDANPEIRKYLPPTDCRLRPDQHAFEEGRFEQANELKTALESHQRSTRMQRERGELPAHKPRWFRQAMDPDSGQGYWEPARRDDASLEYWNERNENHRRISNGTKSHWQDVDEIFGITI